MDTKTRKEASKMNVKLRYDGKWTFLKGDNRQWTIMNHFIDSEGEDRFRGSFGVLGLVELGILKEAR